MNKTASVYFIRQLIISKLSNPSVRRMVDYSYSNRRETHEQHH